MMGNRRWKWLGLAAMAGIGLSFTQCTTLDQAGREQVAGRGVGEGPLRFEISLSERQLYVYQNEELAARHPVAIGKPTNPTPTGSWTIDQIDWNPDWTPPDSEWAEDREYKAPGERGNPMGRARIIFNRPYTIHGTQELGSLGRAASHGSVRVANDVVIQLGRMIMENHGASRPGSWYREVLAEPTKMQTVRIPNPVPIRIRN